MFIAALFTIAKIWKQPKYSSIDDWIKKKKKDDWIKKVWYIYTKEYYSAIKKWNLAIWDNMDRPWGHYAKRKKSDRERQILHALFYMWNLKTNRASWWYSG